MDCINRVGEKMVLLFHPLMALKRDTWHGVFQLLFGSTCEGKPKVTNNKKIIGTFALTLKMIVIKDVFKNIFFSLILYSMCVKEKIKGSNSYTVN